jgi:hypothetical protein
MVWDGNPIVVVGSVNRGMVAYARRIPLTGEAPEGAGFQLHPGGKDANRAVALRRLGYPVHMIGRVGNGARGCSTSQIPGALRRVAQKPFFLCCIDLVFPGALHKSDYGT